MFRKMILFVVSVFVFSISAFAQNGWVFQQSSVPHQALSSVFFLDKYTGWAVCATGDIIHTTDEGNMWSNISYLDSHLRDIQFTDFMNGWLTNSDGFVYHSTDGGLNWEKPNTFDSSTSSVSIYFVDSLRGWAVGYGSPKYPDNYDGRIIHTSNGGIDWVVQSVSEWQLLDVHFVDLLKGWAVGIKGTIFHTINGGTSWIRQDSTLTNVDLKSVFFIDSLIGWAVGGNLDYGGSGIILHTSNGGTSWFSQNLTIDTTILDIFFVNSNKGWAIGNGGTILYTSNGGSNWNFQNSGVKFDLVSVCFVDSATGWISGWQDTILHTTNGGMTFFKEDKNNPSLAKCSPNPFTQNSTFEYHVVVPTYVKLSVYDNYGREIDILLNEYEDVGEYKKIIDAKGFASGVYYLRLDIRGQVVTEKILIIR